MSLSGDGDDVRTQPLQDRAGPVEGVQRLGHLLEPHETLVHRDRRIVPSIPERAAHQRFFDEVVKLSLRKGFEHARQCGMLRFPQDRLFPRQRRPDQVRRNAELTHGYGRGHRIFKVGQDIAVVTVASRRGRGRRLIPPGPEYHHWQRWFRVRAAVEAAKTRNAPSFVH